MMTIPETHPGNADYPDRRLSTGHHGVRPNYAAAPRNTARSPPCEVKTPAQLWQSAARTSRNRRATPRPNRVRPQPTIKSP